MMTVLRYKFKRFSVYSIIITFILVTFHILNFEVHNVRFWRSTTDGHLPASVDSLSNIYHDLDYEAPSQIQTSSNLPYNLDFRTTTLFSAPSRTTLATSPSDGSSGVVATRNAPTPTPSFEKVIVMAKLATENTSWVADNLPELAPPTCFSIPELCSLLFLAGTTQSIPWTISPPPYTPAATKAAKQTPTWPTSSRTTKPSRPRWSSCTATETDTPKPGTRTHRTTTTSSPYSNSGSSSFRRTDTPICGAIPRSVAPTRSSRSATLLKPIVHRSTCTPERGEKCSATTKSPTLLGWPVVPSSPCPRDWFWSGQRAITNGTWSGWWTRNMGMMSRVGFWSICGTLSMVGERCSKSIFWYKEK